MNKVRKIMKFNAEAREELIAGISLLAKAVVTTMGPKGRNVGLGRKWNAPRVVHDGVSVAREVESDNPFQQMGIEMAREAATKTNDVAGDGTTTSILLTEAVAVKGNELVKKGADPMTLQSGLLKATEIITDELLKRSVPISGSKNLAEVATISAADPVVGNLLSDIFDKIGEKGTVYVEEGRNSRTEVEYKEGMEFDRGLSSAFFSTVDDKVESSLSNPYIFITNERIVSNSQVFPLLNCIKDAEKDNYFNVVIIADKIEYEALTTLYLNHNKGLIKVIPVEAPGFGDKREELLEDIAVLVGGKVFSPKKGMTFENLDLTMFGRSDNVWSGKETTKIIGGSGDKDLVALRVRQLETLLKEEKSDYEKEKLEERIARLAGSVAIIKVGATTETELSDRTERIKDAVSATKAALAEGILPGGGVSLLKVRNILNDYKFDEEEELGKDLLFDVLSEPIKKLFEISGVDEANILEIEKSDLDYGYNISTKEFGSMTKMGVIDPTKVVRSGLQHAVSVAGTILTTEVLIAVEDVVSDSSKSE